MSDSRTSHNSAEPRPAEEKSASHAAGRLINPAVREYMDTLSLQRFYGGYQAVEMDPQVFNLGIGEVGSVSLPEDVDKLFARFMQRGTEALRATRYQGTMGVRETNQAVAEDLNTWLGEARFDDMGVLSLDGGHNAVEVAVRAFTSPLRSARGQSQYVLMASPCYPYFSSIVSAQCGIHSFLAYDAEGFTRGVETYCNPAVGLIIINVPHNPMGYALTEAQARRINTVAEAYDCAILVDGVYANFPDPQGGGPDVGTALAVLDPERTVFVESFSKKFGLPGLRVGFALSANRELIYAMRFIKMAESLSPSTEKLSFAGYLLREHGDIPGHIGQVVRERNRRFLERFDVSQLDGVQVLSGGANPFYMALDVSGLCKRKGINDVELTAHCLERFKVKVYPGAFVYPHPKLPHVEFSGVGRHNTHGPTPYLPPRFEEGHSIVYAPGHVAGRTPLLRLSFGAETRPEAAAEALHSALADLR